MGRPFVILSLVLHVVGFALIVGVPRLLARTPQAAPIYVVDLVSMPGGGPAGPQGGAPAAPPPPAKESKPLEKPAEKTPPKPVEKKPAEKKPPAPKKPAEKAIVIPDKDAKKAAAKTPVKPAPAPEPAAASNETASNEDSKAGAADGSASGKAMNPDKPVAVGAGGQGAGAGGGGTGSGLGGDEYNFYLALLDKSIRGAWKRPLYKGTQVFSAMVRLRVSRSGRVLKLDLVQKSGLDAHDQSVLRAVSDAEPFPPFPSALNLDSIDVQFLFELNPEGADDGSSGG